MLGSILTGCTSDPSTTTPGAVATHEVRDDLRSLYDSLGVSGSFVVCDAGRDHWIYVDSAMAAHPTLPASTWKIMGSLIGLESGVVSGADHVLNWDGTVRDREELNKDLSLYEAYHISSYWYHQRIAQLIGPVSLKHWLDTVGYGNRDTTGGYDRCWIRGNLRITPLQQVEFLQRLHTHELPFSERTVEIVKGIMIQEETPSFIHRGKTGWAMTDTEWIGWYIGYIERKDESGPYIFANRLIITDTMSTTFGAARRAIAMEILNRSGMLE